MANLAGRRLNRKGHFGIFVPQAPSILVLEKRNYRFYLFDISWYFSTEHIIHDVIRLTYAATSYAIHTI